MKTWGYEVRDWKTHTLLKKESGFLSEWDAELQGNMEVSADNIKGCYVRTIEVDTEPVNA